MKKVDNMEKKICTKKNIEKFINECGIGTSEIEDLVEDLYPLRFARDISHLYSRKQDRIGIYIIKYLYRNYDFVNKSVVIKNIKLMASTGELRKYENTKQREMDYIFMKLLLWVEEESLKRRNFRLSEFIETYNCDGYCFVSNRDLKTEIYSYMECKAKESLNNHPYKYYKCFKDDGTFNPGYYIWREYKEHFCKEWIGEVGDGHYEYNSEVPVHCYSESTSDRDVLFTKEIYRWFKKYQCYEFEATEEQIKDMDTSLLEKLWRKVMDCFNNKMKKDIHKP